MIDTSSAKSNWSYILFFSVFLPMLAFYNFRKFIHDERILTLTAGVGLSIAALYMFFQLFKKIRVNSKS